MVRSCQINYVWICFFPQYLFGLIGFLDDYQKIKYQNHKGLNTSTKFILQIIISLLLLYLYLHISYLNEIVIVHIKFSFF